MIEFVSAATVGGAGAFALTFLVVDFVTGGRLLPHALKWVVLTVLGRFGEWQAARGPLLREVRVAASISREPLPPEGNIAWTLQVEARFEAGPGGPARPP